MQAGFFLTAVVVLKQLDDIPTEDSMHRSTSGRIAHSSVICMVKLASKHPHYPCRRSILQRCPRLTPLPLRAPQVFGCLQRTQGEQVLGGHRLGAEQHCICDRESFTRQLLRPLGTNALKAVLLGQLQADFERTPGGPQERR